MTDGQLREMGRATLYREIIRLQEIRDRWSSNYDKLHAEYTKLWEENERQRRDLNAWKRMDNYYKKKFDLEQENAKLRKVVEDVTGRGWLNEALRELDEEEK
jgi:hypothetical protein